MIKKIFESKRELRKYLNKCFPKIRCKVKFILDERGKATLEYKLPENPNDCEKCFDFFVKTREFYIRRWKNGYIKKEDWSVNWSR